MCWSGFRGRLGAGDGVGEVGEDAEDWVFAFAVEGLVDEAVAVDGTEECGLRERAGVKGFEGFAPGGRQVGGEGGVGPDLAEMGEGGEAVGEVGGALDVVGAVGGGVLLPVA